MVIVGKARFDRKTKNLVKRLQPHEIAVIDHEDLDELAALSLVKARVKAVINARPSITGKYPNTGPLILLKHHIPLIDNTGPAVCEIKDGEIIVIRDEAIFAGNVFVAKGIKQTRDSVLKMMEQSKANMQQSMGRFIDNTLFHAGLERNLFLGDLEIPPLVTSFRDRPALIVVRGKNYREDLLAVEPYIRDIKPVLVGVDGGADALCEYGYKPDVIFGDMDSVSDGVLKCGAELVVHAYADGYAPGLERIRRMGLPARVFAAPGTSEDAAMLLAYHGNAQLIVAVGTHTNIIDFLEKGRNGMASTILTRIKVGSILVDAKGVSKLYNRPVGIVPVFQVILAAIFPFIMIIWASAVLSQLGRLILLKLKVLMRF